MYQYQFAHEVFSEGDWSVRADVLNSHIHAAVDRLIATGVDPTELSREDVFVRAFFTMGPGPETITARAVERLASVHATIWIDVS